MKRASQLCLAASDVRRKPGNWSVCNLARFVVTTNLDLFGLDPWPEADSAAIMEQKTRFSPFTTTAETGFFTSYRVCNVVFAK
jgi:hypothetical protein